MPNLLKSNLLKFAFVLILLAGCETPAGSQVSTGAAGTQDSEAASQQESELPTVNWKEGERTTKAAPATGEFKVKFETNVGDFTMLVHRDWAPRGAERFHQLIKSKFFDGAPFYRVLPTFMVQFGMCGDPKGTQYWDESFLDDPVKESNKIGRVTYAMAGANTRSTQLFINYADNGRLDGDGFAPFAEVIEGMENIRKINSEYKQEPKQERLANFGNKYAFKEFPNISYIIKATFVEDEASEKKEGEHAEGEKGEHKHEEGDHSHDEDDKDSDHKEGEKDK